MNTLRAILERFEESMMSVSFAEAGEFETAGSLLGRNKTANKRVLLGTDRIEIRPGIIGDALQLCRRIGGSLEIFHLLELPDGRSEEDLLGEKQLLDRLTERLLGRKVVYQPVRATGCLADQLCRHVGTRRDILCVVYDALESGESSCLKAREKMIAHFQALSCPVMVRS